jgi:hypothetical protein
MAAMATPKRAMRQPVIELRGPSQRVTWALWIIVTVIGAVVGALAAWQVRQAALSGGNSFLEASRYLATVLEVVVGSGAQWYVLKRYHLEVYWWVPATVSARLLAAIVVIPSVAHVFVPPGGTDITMATAILSGAAALAAAGFVVGAAQSVVLRTSGGNIAFAWIPATIVGGGLAGALTTAMSAQLFGLQPIATITLLATVGALLTAASQAPVLLRLLR